MSVRGMKEKRFKILPAYQAKLAHNGGRKE
jgi:hypothetical protein